MWGPSDAEWKFIGRLLIGLLLAGAGLMFGLGALAAHVWSS